MLSRKWQARPRPSPTRKFFQSCEILHLIGEIVLADNHLPKQVTTEVLFIGVHHFVLTFCVDENSVSDESNV